MQIKMNSKTYVIIFLSVSSTYGKYSPLISPLLPSSYCWQLGNLHSFWNIFLISIPFSHPEQTCQKQMKACLSKVSKIKCTVRQSNFHVFRARKISFCFPSPPVSLSVSFSISYIHPSLLLSLFSLLHLNSRWRKSQISSIWTSTRMKDNILVPGRWAATYWIIKLTWLR